MDQRPVDLIVSWRKACDCQGKSSVGHVRLRTERTDDGYKVIATVEPGPVCDECLTPWVGEPANKELSE